MDGRVLIVQSLVFLGLASPLYGQAAPKPDADWWSLRPLQRPHVPLIKGSAFPSAIPSTPLFWQSSTRNTCRHLPRRIGAR